MAGMTQQQYMEAMAQSGMSPQYAQQSWEHTQNIDRYGNAAGAQGQNPYQSPLNMNPSTIAGQFPGGIPSMTPGSVNSSPMNPYMVGMPNSIHAQQIHAPQIGQQQQVSAQSIMDPQSIYGQMGPGAYSSQGAIDATNAYLAPQFQQQDRAMTESLANAGIVGGTSGRAVADLGRQQQQTMQHEIQPYLLARQQMQQSAVGQDVGNRMQQQMQNQVANLQAQGMNLNAALQVATQNAAMEMQAQGMNQGAALQAAQSSAQNYMQAQGMNQGAAQQAGMFNSGQNMQAQQFNAGQSTGAQQFNISNLLNTAQQDSGSYNQMLQFLAQLQQQGWLGQMGAMGNLAQGGMQGQQNAFQPNYQQPGQFNMGGMASAFAPQRSPQGGGYGGSFVNHGNVGFGGTGSSPY